MADYVCHLVHYMFVALCRFDNIDHFINCIGVEANIEPSATPPLDTNDVATSLDVAPLFTSIFSPFPFTIHSIFCLTTGSKHPPQRFFHIMRSRVSSFKRVYHLLSLRSSSSFLRLLPRLLVTSISPFIFPSITCFRSQFLHKT